MSNGVICVDISNYQKGFNFQQFAAGGGLGVILKATEGTTVKDASYATFRPQALAAGLKVATYHFFRTSDTTQQADFYYNFARPSPGERVVCDFEDDNATIDSMITFLKRLQSIDPTLQLTLYSGHTIKDKLGNATNPWLAANTALWLAQYTTGSPTWPKQVWTYYSLWQYSDQGRVAGFSGNVDSNRFNGSNDAFVAWMGPAGEPAPAPPPDAAIPVVTVSISADQPVQLVVNGVPVAQ